ncbi:MAG: helix-turn-helix domain-containing protein [Saprospiraceae bacterium]
MNGKIYKPSKELNDFVMSYWTLDFPKEVTPKMNTIIPDGTMKLIFHYGDLYWHHPKDGNSFLQPRCFLIGQLTQPYVVEPDGDTGTFVVRFHPNGFLPFANIPIKEMENTPVPLNKLFGIVGETLEKNILEAQTTTERIHIIEAFLLQYLTDSKTIDTIVKSTIDTILTANGQVSISELSEKNHIHRRQLARKFSSVIGLSPKQLSKTIRLQSALKKLLTQKSSKLTDLAYDSEYYDQSHFIKDFREFTGLSPKEFYGDDLKMSLLFEEKD